MKIFLAIFFLITNCASTFSQKINDPDVEIRQVKNFHGINVEDAFDVYLSQSEEEVVAISGSEKDKKYITTEVKNGILNIRLDAKGVSVHWGNRKLRAYISFKQIDRISVKGACNVMIAGALKLNELSIQLSGASDLRGDLKAKLEINKLGIDISGASDMIVAGKVGSLYIEASGASKFKGFDLTADMCDVRASGASDIKITVNKELTANVSGATDLKYKGEGVVKEIRSSGSSTISKG
jgi:Putative auto-transporter adhesin, head GIN domain